MILNENSIKKCCFLQTGSDQVRSHQTVAKAQVCNNGHSVAAALQTVEPKSVLATENQVVSKIGAALSERKKTIVLMMVPKINNVLLMVILN